MQISKTDWGNYIDLLSKLNTTAGNLMRAYVAKNGLDDKKALIDYAFGLVTKYGEGSAALAAQMYDETATMSGKILPPAEVAETADQNEVAKAIQGIAKTSVKPRSFGNAVNRLVKRAAADTTLKNAKRDGAQFAWIPVGDTCPFCLVLASRDFQYISKKTWKNGHAEHIHANCDCNYAVRFDKSSGVEGYDPEKLLEMYKNAEGETSKEKINYLRRLQYDNPSIGEKIRAQHRETDALRKIENAINVIKAEDVTSEYNRNALPGIGKVDKQQGFKDVNGEESVADWLHKTFGRDILLLADDHPEGEANPDYLWAGRIWDLKAPKTSNENTIDKRIQHGIWQIEKNTGGVIVDFSNSKLSLAEGIQIVDKYGNKRSKETTDFIVKKDNRYKVLRVKK